MYTATFEVPRPGAWELDTAHWVRPVSRWIAEVFPPALMRGFKESTQRYGALLSHMEPAVIDGFVYLCPRPVGAPDGAKGPPPRLVFWLLSRLHPELRRRIRRAREVFEAKLWREDVDRWDREWRPEIDRTNASLQAMVPAKLDRHELVEHLEACRVALDHAIYRHHSLNLCCLLPTGDFLVQASEWTGLPPSELLGLLRGASPVSAGATTELERLAHAFASDPESTSVLASSAPADRVFERLRSAPSSVGPSVQAYLDVVGWRIITGYDVADSVALEVPEMLVTAMRSTLAARRRTDDDVDIRIARVRDAVPPAHREAFDLLLHEARLTYRIRDERCYLNDARTLGLARRALLEAGRRLVESGHLEAAEHAVDLTPAEARSLLMEGRGPSASEVAAYATYRMTKKMTDAPSTLGLPPSGPPPAEWLPPSAARTLRAIGAALSGIFDVSSRRSEAEVVRGLPASAGTVEGVARLVSGPAAFARVQTGDIIVAPTTGPTYNVLLPTIGGIITDRGGLLSHAAIVAREYGIPAVVGTVDATTAIADGRRVRVDGSTGEVFLL
jgi:pyruvate,water dikinase